MHESARLTESLAVALTVPLDLAWYGGPAETPAVHRGITAGSVLVYQRDR
jgi:hypothetical protein